jgi:hypothetical protein
MYIGTRFAYLDGVKLMRITEHEISWLLLGAAIGWLVTYWHLTKEKRIISSVRREIADLALYHNLTKDQYRKACYTEGLVDDQQIMQLYHWTQKRISTSTRLKKVGPIVVVAETIICEKVLGLSHIEAMRALLNAKDREDLRTLQRKISN